MKENIIEKYAKNNLHYYINNEENYFNKDKPDLQNERDSIGIEVVENAIPDEKECIRIWNEIADLPYSTAKEYPKITSKRFKGELICADNKGHKAFSPTKGLVDFKIYIENAAGLIIKKLEKLNSYKQFGKMGLFVYAGKKFYETDVNEMFNHIDSNKNSNLKHYDFYIIDCGYDGYYCFYDNNNKLQIKYIKKSDECSSLSMIL